MTAEEAKRTLDKIIDDISKNPGNLVRNPRKDFTRDRKLPLNTMLRIIIHMQGGTLKEGLDHYDAGVDVTTSAFIQQRDKILPEMFETIFHKFCKHLECGNLYKGYRLLAVDGSTITIATDKNSDTYVYHENGNFEYNAFHLNAMFDLLNKYYTDVVIQSEPQRHEVKAALIMAKRMDLRQKTILICDRNYGSLNLLENIHRIPGLEYLIRVKNSWLTETRDMPMADIDTDIEFELRTTQTKEDRALRKAGKIKYISGHAKTGQATKMQESWEFESPFRMKLRIVRFSLDSGEYETIVTSLPRNRFPAAVIKELYHMRWAIETSFRDLKYTAGLSNLHTKKEAAALQEIYARLVMYNFSRSIIMSVAVDRKKPGKWIYQINVKHAVRHCREYFRHHGAGPPPDIVAEIAKAILPVRPGRTDPRKRDKRREFVWFTYRVA